MKKKILIIFLSIFFMNTVRAQEKTKDTLFFKLNKYLYQSKYDSKKYNIKCNGNTNEGAIYFEEYKIIKNLKPKKNLSFKKYTKSLKLYKVNDKTKLDDVAVIKLLSNYIVILVDKKNNKFIEVGTEFAIQ